MFLWRFHLGGRSLDVPAVSVVIPTYNRTQLLKRAVESVIRQTFHDFELLIINDGDCDEEIEKILTDINDSRIRSCRNERSKGGSGARNTGILKSRGKYIALLDDDDEWLPEKLEEQIRLLKGLGSTWGGCYCGNRTLEGGRWRDVCHSRAGNIKRDFLLLKNPASSGSTLVFDRDAIERVGLFDEHLERQQDIHFLVSFLRYYKLAYVKKCLVKIYPNKRPPAATLERAKLMLFEKISTDLLELSSADRRHFYAMQFKELAAAFAFEGKSNRGFYYLKKSLACKLLFPTRYMSIVLNILDSRMKLGISPIFESLKLAIKRNRVSSKLLKRIL